MTQAPDVPQQLPALVTSGTWQWNTQTGVPPITSQLRTNTGNWDQATTINLHKQDTGSQDISSGMARVVIGDAVRVQHKNDAARWAEFRVTTLPVATGAYFAVGVALTKSYGALPNSGTEVLVDVAYSPGDPTFSGQWAWSPETAIPPNNGQLRTNTGLGTSTTTINLSCQSSGGNMKANIGAIELGHSLRVEPSNNPAYWLEYTVISAPVYMDSPGPPPTPYYAIGVALASAYNFSPQPSGAQLTFTGLGNKAHQQWLRDTADGAVMDPGAIPRSDGWTSVTTPEPQPRHVIERDAAHARSAQTLLLPSSPGAPPERAMAPGSKEYSDQLRNERNQASMPDDSPTS